MFLFDTFVIEMGTYGYSEETGKQIGLKRLEARPVETLCFRHRKGTKDLSGKERKNGKNDIQDHRELIE